MDIQRSRYDCVGLDASQHSIAHATSLGKTLVMSSRTHQREIWSTRYDVSKDSEIASNVVWDFVKKL